VRLNLNPMLLTQKRELTELIDEKCTREEGSGRKLSHFSGNEYILVTGVLDFITISDS